MPRAWITMDMGNRGMHIYIVKTWRYGPPILSYLSAMLDWIDPTPLVSRLPVAIPSQVVLPAFVILGVYGISAIKRRFWDNKTTPLSGPPNPSFFFGHYKTVNQAADRSELYEGWVKEHGPAYWISTGFGSKRIVICDPKANGHFYSKETYGYVQTKLSRVFIENLVCGQLFISVSCLIGCVVRTRVVVGGGR